MRLNKIFTALLFTSLLVSCKIGNFMDIRDNNDGALYLYAATASGLLTFQVDTVSGSLSDKGTDSSIPTQINACKFVYENEKKNLFFSYGTNPYYISGYDVKGDGSLDMLPGYPASFGTYPVDDYVFTDDKRFLYAISSDGSTPHVISGFNYNSDGSLSPTAQGTFSAYTPPAEGFLIFDTHLLKNDGTGWNSYTIAGDGTLGNYLNGYSLGAGTGECPAVLNGYLFKLLLGAGGSNYGYSYNLDIHNTTAAQISSPIVGATAGSSTSNALVKDPKERFLYFVSINENNIYCLRTNTDGTISTINYIPTGVNPGAAAIDPYREFFFTASEDGGGGFQINIHRMNGDLPESTFNIRGGMPGQIFELSAVRYSSD